MSELPETWESLPLGRACDVIRGITFPASAKQATETKSNVACLRTANIQNEVEWHDIYFVSDEYVKRDDQLVKPGDTLMSMANSYNLVGKVALAKVVPYKTAFGAFLSAVRPTSLVSPLYLFHLLRTSHVQSELRAGSSQTTNIANISIGKLSSIEIPLAPLAEQKRIADKLEAVLGRVDACRTRLDRVPALLKRFRQSVLAAATSGELTEEWREKTIERPEASGDVETSDSVELPTGWRVAALGTLVQNHDNRRIPIKASDRSRRSGAYPYYGAFGIIDTIDDFLFDGEYVLLAEDGKNLESRERPIALIATGKFWVNNHAHVLQPKEELCIGYLNLSLNSPTLEIDSLLTGIDQIKLTRGAMDRIQVNVPPVPEQAEIVRRVEALFAFADRIEARLAAAQKTVERLTPAILAKAFRGELVPQDPNDEPAAALLARLAGQAAEAPRKRARTKSPARS